MAKTTILIGGLLAASVALSAACQNAAKVNINSASDPHAGHSMDQSTSPANGHDMSDMKHDMSNMGAMASAPGAAEQPFDLQFIDSMVHHHEGAVMMSKMALEKTENAELRPFLQRIVDDKDREIARLKEWRKKWYPGNPSALNMEMPGMNMGAEKMGMSSHEREMRAMAGTDFDLHFIDMMIRHHEGAALMAKDALQKAEHAEIKTLSDEVIRGQEAEINQMREWKKKWAR